MNDYYYEKSMNLYLKWDGNRFDFISKSLIYYCHYIYYIFHLSFNSNSFSLGDSLISNLQKIKG